MNTCCLYSLDQYLGKKFAVKLLSSFSVQSVGFCTPSSPALVQTCSNPLGELLISLQRSTQLLQHTSGRLLPERHECAVQAFTREQQSIQVLPRGLEAPFLASGYQMPKSSLKETQQNKQVLLGKQNSFSVCRQYSWGKMKCVTKTTLKNNKPYAAFSGEDCHFDHLTSCQLTH